MISANVFASLITKVKEAMFAPMPGIQEGTNILDVPNYRNNFGPKLDDAVNAFNAVALPTMFCGVDGRGYLHITLIGEGRKIKDGPTQVMHTADFVWSYDPVTEKYTNLKDRTGEFT